MKRAGPALLVLSVALTAPQLFAQSTGEMFQTIKDDVHEGAWADALKTIEKLDAEATRAGNEKLRAQLEGPTAFYRGVCEANLDRTSEAVASFEEFLRVQPSATLESSIYSKKVVSAFEQARRKKAAKPFSLAEAYKTFQPPAVRPEDHELVDEYWADGPVRWILTAEERRAWDAVDDPQARVEFVEHFWAVRAALPGTAGRTFREEYERRVAFADAYFGQREGELRGSLTDRGMVFVLLGPPFSAARRAGGNDDSSLHREPAPVSEKTGVIQVRPPFLFDAADESSCTISVVCKAAEVPLPTGGDVGETVETWHYRGDELPSGVGYQSLDVHYVTKRGYGRNVLQRESETLATLGAAANHGAPSLTARR